MTLMAGARSPPSPPPAARGPPATRWGLTSSANAARARSRAAGLSASTAAAAAGTLPGQQPHPRASVGVAYHAMADRDRLDHHVLEAGVVQQPSQLLVVGEAEGVGPRRPARPRGPRRYGGSASRSNPMKTACAPARPRPTARAARRSPAPGRTAPPRPPGGADGQDERPNDRIEGAIRERQRLRIAGPEIQLRVIAPRHRQHSISDIDAHGLGPARGRRAGDVPGPVATSA